MGERFTGWHRKSGDVNASPALRDVGKKLLGYLQRQMELGAPPTSVIRRRLPDGSEVHAFMEFGRPAVRFFPPRSRGGRSAPFSLTGFITRPQDNHLPATFGDFPEAVVAINPVGIGFYDPSYYPDPAGTAQRGRYDRTPSAQPLFPDGLLAYGNTDWRSQDESLTVNWVGGSARYFAASVQIGPYVFRNGQVLLDTRDYGPDLLGYTNPAVAGACVRKHDGDIDTAAGHWLYMVWLTQPSFDLRQCHLVRVPLHADPYPNAPPSPTFASAPRWACGDTAELLLTWDEATDTYPLMQHPWCFNQSGTEARRITAKGGDFEYTCEQVLDLEDATDPSYTEINTEIGTSTLTDLLDDLAETYHPDRLGQAVLTSTRSYASDTEPTTSQYVVAVDYRDDEPVYAYRRTKTRQVRASHEANGTATVDDITPHYAQEVNLVQTLTEDRLDDGLVVDWMSPILATYSRTYAIEQQLGWDTAGPNSYGSATDTDVSEGQVLTLWHLDLRYRWLAYSIRTTSDDWTNVYEGTQSPDTGLTGSWPIPSFDAMGFTSTRHTVNSITTRVTLNGELLAETTGIIDESGPTTTTGTVSRSYGVWSDIFIGESSSNAREGFINTTRWRQAFNIGLIDRISWSGTSTLTGTDSAPTSTTTSISMFVPRSPDQLVSLLHNWIEQGNHTPDGNNTVHYGGWCSYRNHWVFSQPMPTGDDATAHNWLSLCSQGELTAGSGLDADLFYPISLLPPVAVGVAR